MKNNFNMVCTVMVQMAGCKRSDTLYRKNYTLTNTMHNRHTPSDTAEVEKKM